MPRPANVRCGVRTFGASQGKGIEAPVRVWDVEHDRNEFAEFYAAARDDCLRIVLFGAMIAGRAELIAPRVGSSALDS